MPEVLRAEDEVELHSSAGPTNDEPELIDSERCATENEVNRDDVMGDELDRVHVRAGQQLEMEMG